MDEVPVLLTGRPKVLATPREEMFTRSEDHMPFTHPVTSPEATSTMIQGKNYVTQQTMIQALFQDLQILSVLPLEHPPLCFGRV